MCLGGNKIKKRTTKKWTRAYKVVYLSRDGFLSPYVGARFSAFFETGFPTADRNNRVSYVLGDLMEARSDTPGFYVFTNIKTARECAITHGVWSHAVLKVMIPPGTAYHVGYSEEQIAVMKLICVDFIE